MSDAAPPSPIDWSARPRLRALDVEAQPVSDDEPMFILHDPGGASAAALTVSLPALHLLSLMDGTRTLSEVRGAFGDATGQLPPEATMADLLQHLDTALFLEGPRYERRYAEMLAAYRSAPGRPCGSLQAMGLDGEDPLGSLEGLFDWPEPTATAAPRGLVAPHLDYVRGRPCYRAAYAELHRRACPDRVVILGTNHFGRSHAVVATAQPFATPWGSTAVDQAALDDLGRRCDADLLCFEMDHAREHSVELQVLLLQHLFGATAFQIVPVLCPSPCGPTGTAPSDGRGVDLGLFADALGAAIREWPGRTCLVAGADFSHCGRAFGDDVDLDDTFLQRIAMKDHQVIDALVANDLDGFVDAIAGDDNATRICSAGCLYVLRRALSRSRARLLDYHQAVHAADECHVSCAALVFE